MSGTMQVGLTLAVQDLAAERGGRPVFAGIGFVLDAREAIAVVGRNGSGKSTLLRVLAGLLPVAAGRIALDPPDADDPDVTIGERAHYLGHADALKAALTPLDHLGFAARLLGGGGATPARALQRVSLSHVADLPCAYLSAGQRRRVAIARLLVAARPLWLLDEPATALDAASQRVISEMMREHLDAGGLVVAATHAPLGIDGVRELRLGPT